MPPVRLSLDLSPINLTRPDTKLFILVVFNKIILTTLHYTPQLLAHHLPLKQSVQTGKFKLTKQPPPALMKMILSYMSNLIHLVQQLPDDKEGGGLLKVCLKGAEGMVPWIVGARKVVKSFLKVRPFAFFSP